ncbi:MAG: ankyrin repeat domain-containing protein [Gammaproteobacteria bacterium]
MQKTINAVLFVFAVLFGAAGFSVSANAQEARPCDLCIAAATGDTAKITELIAAGAEVNITTYYGGMPLMYAARHGRAAAVDLLIENGADKDAQDDRGLTPVMIAVLAHQAEVVSILLVQHGVNGDIPMNNGWTPLLYASLYGADGTLYLPLATNTHYSRNTGPGGLTPLMAAAAGNNVPHANFHARLLGSDVDNNAGNDHGTTALMFAAYFGHEEVLSTLAAPGGNSNLPVQIDTRDNDGRTAAMIAAARAFETNDPRYTNILGILLNRGADLTLEDNSGFSATDYGQGSAVPGQNGLPPLSPSLQDFTFSLSP